MNNNNPNAVVPDNIHPDNAGEVVLEFPNDVEVEHNNVDDNEELHNGGDDDDDDEEPQGEDDDDDEEDEAVLNPDVLEGGIADADQQQDESIRLASQADITLFFVCTESFDHIYDTDVHEILRPEVTVQIGLGKSTRLDKVMKRYVHICNEHRPEGSPALQLSDVDFTHVQLLSQSDTPEAAALMNNDKVKVSRERKLGRLYDLERCKLQRESDKIFFQQWRGWSSRLDCGKNVALLCRNGSDGHEVEVDVRGGRHGSHGFEMVRCDDAVVSKRCMWLGALISQAKHQKEQLKARSQAGSRASNRSDDDDFLQPMPAGERLHDHDGPQPMHVDEQVNDNHGRHAAQIENDDVLMVLHNQLAAAEIENDDDDYYEADRGIIRVTINFPAEAVRLLLEFVYTNRVVAFGIDAFLAACRTRPSEKRMLGPVPPFDIDRSKRWPNKGEPTVLFDTCMAAIELAETASLPRFSLMAEFAASLQVSARNVVRALTLCEKIRQRSGNALPRLRRSAMEVLLRSHHMLNSLSDTLIVQGDELLPVLLTGVADAVEAEDNEEHYMKRKKARLDAAPDEWRRNALLSFPTVDRKEKSARERERSSRRREMRRVRFGEHIRPRGQGLKRSARHLTAEGGGHALAGSRGDGVETRSMEARAAKRRTRRGG